MDLQYTKKMEHKNATLGVNVIFFIILKKLFKIKLTVKARQKCNVKFITYAEIKCMVILKKREKGNILL